MRNAGKVGMRRVWLAVFLCAGIAAAGENPAAVPLAEIEALDRVIRKEANSGQLGSRTLDDLYRLKTRLLRLQLAASEAKAALAPLDGDDSQRRQLERLEREAETGGRAAERSLALYYLFLNDPEKALARWRRMGGANNRDLQYRIISSYLEFALGEYGAGRKSLEAALWLMEARTSLAVSAPVFCQNIGGYRVYTPRKQGDLLPGEDTLLYVEVEGAEFVDTPDGSECRVLFGLQLRNEAERTVWAASDYGEYAPVFAGPIRDLHAVLSWRVPNDLEPGRYSLRVEASENSTGRHGEGVAAFTVGRREPAPEKGPPGPALSPAMSREVRDAQRVFSGPGASDGDDQSLFRGDGPSGGRFPDAREFDLIQRYQQGQRVQ